MVASDGIEAQSYLVTGLQPDTAYMFLVRAENSHGISFPSKLTDPIRTRGTYDRRMSTFTYRANFVLVRKYEELINGDVAIYRSIHSCNFRCNQPRYLIN